MENKKVYSFVAETEGCSSVSVKMKENKNAKHMHNVTRTFMDEYNGYFVVEYNKDNREYGRMFWADGIDYVVGKKLKK